MGASLKSHSQGQTLVLTKDAVEAINARFAEKEAA